MKTVSPGPVVLAIYGAAIFVFALALVSGLSLGGPAGLFCLRVVASASLLLVVGATFQWGGQRGYRIVVPGRGLNLSHLLRNLVMVACVVPILILLGSPVFALVMRIVRPH